MPAATGLLPAVVHPEDLQRANGLRLTAMASGEILGPLVAGALVVAAGAGWAIAIDAATFAVSALLLARLAIDAEVPAAAKTFLHDLRDGWRAFRSRTWVWTMVARRVAREPVLGSVDRARRRGRRGPPRRRGRVGDGAGRDGHRWRRRRPARDADRAAPPARRLQRSAGAVLALPLAMLAAEAPLAVVAAGALAAGVALMLGNTLFESTLQRHIPQNEISRVSELRLARLARAPAARPRDLGPAGRRDGDRARRCGSPPRCSPRPTLAPLLVREVRELPAQPTT